MLSDIVRGQEVTDVTEFFDEFGNPLKLTQAPIFVVRDFHGNLITKGHGAQDPVSPQQWSCSFTIPDHCPITDNTYYTLHWSALAPDGTKQANVTKFTVQDNLEEYPHEEGQIAFYQQPFLANLHLPFQVTGLSLRICRDNTGTSQAPDILFLRNDPKNFTVKRAGRGYLYSVPVLVDSNAKQYSNGLDESSIAGLTGGGVVGSSADGTGNNNNSQTTSVTNTAADGTTTTTSSTMTTSYSGGILNSGLGTGGINTVSASAWGYNELFLYWNYTDKQGNQETIIERLYVVNGTMVRMMDDMRRNVDMIRNKWSIPQLRITEIKLAHFALQGMNWFNSMPPSANGNWALGNLPQQFYDIVLNGAMARLCEAQYLATGMTQFQFSGQAVSLSSDYSQYWEQAAQTYSRRFEETVSAAKRAAIKIGVGNSLGITWGPTTLVARTGGIGTGNLGALSSYSGLSPALPFFV